MKVLHIVKTAFGAKWAFEQIVALRSLGVEAVVALPSDRVGMAAHYRAAGVPVLEADLDLPARSPWRLPAVLQTCRQVVADAVPDLIHTHHVGTTLVARLALGKSSPIPRIFGVTGTLHLEHGFFAWLDTHSAAANDFWIATCRWTQQKYEQLGISPDRVFLAYLGTDVRRYPTMRTGRLRNELGISPDVPLVGMVSMIYPPKWFLGASRGHKGHEDFIKAFAQLREKRPDARGVIIGGLWGKGRWYEDRVRYLADRLCGNKLTFFGTRTDVSEIYPDLDLAVVPSHSDGVAFTVTEALLARVPVVATNVGGLSDLIPDGETGWLVPPKNPHSLLSAILDALDNPDEGRRRACEGQKLAARLVDLDTTAQGVRNAYREILSRSRGRFNGAVTLPLERQRAIRTSKGSRREPAVKILHALGTVNPGGVETWLLNVLRNIDKERFDFHFCTFGPESGLYAAEMEKLGATIIRCPKSTNLWQFGRQFRRILREGRYDIVHSHVHFFSGIILRWAKAEGVPIRIAHSHTSRDDARDIFGRGFYARVMRSQINRFATHGLAASKKAAWDLFGENWQSGAQVRVLYYGVNFSDFETPVDQDEVRRQLAIPRGAFVVGHVGRFVEAKNHQFLLRVAEEVLKDHPNIHFLMIGDGPLFQPTRARMRALGLDHKIHFLGTRTDVPRLMRGAMDLFIFPSLYEGFGLALLEAQVAGLHCLASNTVSDEATLAPGSVEYLDLKQGAKYWAAQIVNRLASRVFNPVASVTSLSRFSIQRSVKELVNVYESRSDPALRGWSQGGSGLYQNEFS